MTNKQMLLRILVHVGASGMFYIFCVMLMAMRELGTHPEEWDVFHPYIAMFTVYANITIVAWCEADE